MSASRGDRFGWAVGRVLRRYRTAVAAAALLWTACACAQPTPEQQRDAMIAEIEGDVRRTSGTTGRDHLGEAVLGALRAVPRHEFVPAALRGSAYRNVSLPIGEDQTISQPFIVALMTDLASVDDGSRVLEIGTGSGYQAAVLAQIARDVYTIEIVETLGRRADATLGRLGYDNVHVRIGDGYRGWPEAAPFDAIVVTAAPDEVPAPLIEQLAVGGRLVVPVGAEDEVQSLRVLTKDSAGNVTQSDVLPVRFVPFTREP
ncbi:MAG TPA: protein-L-isoaspartate(D-aspartate) O-methyltransferase [Gammaproteobacteria bacterium]|nr:protein-L-isoaspartate(D-aspartate) O-methyltransferase [Gammaproteobacteria bacterium]